MMNFNFSSMPAWAVVMLILVLTTIFAWPAFKTIEGTFAPVTTKLEIIESKSVGSGEVAIVVDFRKIRDCEFIGLAFFDPLGARVGLQFEVPDEEIFSREVGSHKGVGPWIVNMGADEIDKSTVLAKHECHSLWPTITKMKP